MKLKELFKKYEGDESQWISMSDMMTGLMVIFLLLFFVSTIAKSNLEDEKVKTNKDVQAWIKDYGLLENSYNNLQSDYDNLENEYKNYQSVTASKIDPKEYEDIKIELKSAKTNLRRARTEQEAVHAKILDKRNDLILDLKNIWTSDEQKQLGIEILDTGAIHLNRGYFNTGSSKILPPLRHTLEQMMPQLIEYIKDNERLVEKIEIIGHASPEWPECGPYSQKYGQNIANDKYGGNEEKCKFFENMELSQQRSHSVLREIDKILTNVFSIGDEFQLIKNVFFANGRSSSDKKMSYEKSRRATLYMHYNFDEISSYVLGQRKYD